MFCYGLFIIVGIIDYIKGGYLMRRVWKFYDKCYREISVIGGLFLVWVFDLRCNINGVILFGFDDVEEVIDEVIMCICRYV